MSSASNARVAVSAVKVTWLGAKPTPNPAQSGFEPDAIDFVFQLSQEGALGLYSKIFVGVEWNLPTPKWHSVFNFDGLPTKVELIGEQAEIRNCMGWFPCGGGAQTALARTYSGVNERCAAPSVGVMCMG